ncbi:MAG TPA: cbb3-type cytochrome c oxidase N-terminal domain-containing protein, partial [Polyangiaceae bacterium]|nr:cbb3-type cytochrome c oxidase N-terminal domain-containing protein [Polyangiaceae bacterium]
MSASTHPSVMPSSQAPSSAGSAAGHAQAEAHGEEENLLEHEYDGIREYDNPLPRWWVLLFWGSFWFALAYILTFHVFDRAPSVKQSYEAEMRVVAEERAQAALREKVSEESLAKLTGPAVEAGKGIFQARCVQCHAAEGQGLIGPNLTDNSWIHGQGTLMDIYKTVSEGVLAKGMPAWGLQLRPDELRQVVAFVGSIRGKNVPGKAPEGTPV